MGRNEHLLRMGEMRKIVVEVPADLLAHAQEETGGGIDETVEAGLRGLVARRAQRRLLDLRGSVEFELGLEELRRDE